MAMHMIYRGLFGSRDNNQWDVRIFCERDAAPEEIGILSFPGEEPLVIEWFERAKDEPVCGSTATLNLISPGDRTYIDLFSVEVGCVRLDVYRNDRLYWSGTLDPEFYEEPYSMLDDYDVTLTFSDFGILERLKYNLAGFKTLKELVDYAMSRSGIMFSAIDERYISTMLPNANSPLQLSDLSVRSDNFYDEDGEASSLQDVLDGFMRPLGLKIMQRGGRVWVYDLNGLRQAGDTSKIEWMGTDQVLGVDRVYNNVKITWSPYANCDKLLPEDCWTEPVDVNEVHLNNVNPKTVNGGRCEILSYHYTADLDTWIDGTDVGFTLWLSKYGHEGNVTIDDAEARYFRIVPQNDGSEKEGIAVRWTGWRGSHQRVETGKFLWWDFYEESWGLAANEYGILPANLQSWKLATTSVGLGRIFSSRKEWLPPVAASDNLLLRITLPMLLDCRFNPFESAENLMGGVNGKQRDTFNTWQERGNFVYVPVLIKYQPDGSDLVYVWDNVHVLEAQRKYSVLNDTLGAWVLDSNSPAGYLCYCDSARDGDKCGVMGWKTNRQASGNRTVDVNSWIRNIDDGQFIPYPVIGGHHRGGKIWIEVCKGGWLISDGSNSLTGTISDSGLWQKISFILFQMPQIEAVNNKPYDMEIDNSDVEYSALLNGAAKEDLEIETVCGSRDSGFPLARGAYFRSDNYNQIHNLKRAGRTAPVEQLLIGTLFSQFAQRHTKLSGTTEPPGDRLMIYSEAMQPQNSRFLLTAAVEDCGQDLCESIMVELSPDEYNRNNG